MTYRTLGQLVRETGLARASLLHYEALGLLLPATRGANGYRLYGEREIERLREIRRYREAGLSLAAIGTLLTDSGAADADDPVRLLRHRLFALNTEISRLRGQQKRLATLLAKLTLRRQRPQSKAAWVRLLRQAGLSDGDMRSWHVEFERDDPGGHAEFLCALGLSANEIARIRRDSRAADIPAPATDGKIEPPASGP